MRVLLSTYGSRGDIEPLVALAVQLRPLGAEVWACAPPDAAWSTGALFGRVAAVVHHGGAGTASSELIA